MQNPVNINIDIADLPKCIVDGRIRCHHVKEEEEKDWQITRFQDQSNKLICSPSNQTPTSEDSRSKMLQYHKSL